MTESEWQACTDPELMLIYLRDRASDRKLRLFACACCRHFWEWDGGPPQDVFENAVETAELFADGRVSGEALWDAFKSATARVDPSDPFDNADYAGAATAYLDPWQAADDASCRLRDYMGFEAAYEARERGEDAETARAEQQEAEQEEGGTQSHLLRDLFGNPFQPLPALDPAWLTWSDSLVRRLAQAIYEERDFDRLPILADALEEAGCTDVAVRDHCRQANEHARGCWVLDWILGRE